MCQFTRTKALATLLRFRAGCISFHYVLADIEGGDFFSFFFCFFFKMHLKLAMK